jgi:hypothetical protein
VKFSEIVLFSATEVLTYSLFTSFCLDSKYRAERLFLGVDVDKFAEEENDFSLDNRGIGGLSAKDGGVSSKSVIFYRLPFFYSSN